MSKTEIILEAITTVIFMTTILGVAWAVLVIWG
jgi:hypothetical protein